MTSPSCRHLGHFQTLNLQYGNQENNKTFEEKIWKIHNNITNIQSINETPLLRWLRFVVILLPKDIRKPNIHRLCTINTYESDYNLILKYFFPRDGMKRVEDNKWLGETQTGGRKDTSSIDTATINELINEYHRFIREPFYSHQDDSMGCYDQIIRNNDILDSRKFRITNNVCKLHSRAHYSMQFQN